jgi:hypothetical protein
MAKQAAAGEEGRAGLRRSILLAILYADIFDYPLTASETLRYLPLRRASPEEVAEELAGLCASVLSKSGRYFTLRDREGLADLRRRREKICAPRWAVARRYARWISCIPFVRMVAVCGSQVFENSDEDGDVDLFLITAPRRIWIVRTCIRLLSRVKRFDGVPVCPSFMITEDALAVPGSKRNFYVAHQIAQAIPLLGGDAFFRFLDANDWFQEYLPLFADEARARESPQTLRPKPSFLAEWILGGRLGDRLERFLHGFTVQRLGRLFPARAIEIRAAFQADGQLSVGDGHLVKVRHLFRERVAKTLGDPDRSTDWAYLFPAIPLAEESTPDRPAQGDAAATTGFSPSPSPSQIFGEVNGSPQGARVGVEKTG